jgi:drug/metabolite transporter (DMT)-like permease
MAKMSFGCNTELVFVGIMLALFLTFNIGLNYYDNWILSPGPYPAGLGFPAPLVYAFCHSSASLIGAIGMIYGRSGNKVTMQMFWGHKIKLVLNSLLLTTSIVMAWFLVQHASVALINVFRGAVAVPVLIFAFVLEGKRYSIPKIFTILLIAGGSVISVPFSTFSYTGTGLWLTMAATGCVALKATVSGMLMKDSKRDGMTPIVVLFYDSMFSSLFLGTACMFAGETIRLGQYAPQEPSVVGLGMIVGASLAFPYNFITYKFIQLTSPMGWAIATSFKLFIIIVLPTIFYDHTSWAGSYIGLLLFVVGVALYIMLEAKYEASWLNEVLPGSMSAAEINKKSDVDGTTAGEETPLNKAQDKLNKFTDASEAKKWVPKSWFAM